MQAAEKGLKRLWEAYDNLMKLNAAEAIQPVVDAELETRVIKLIEEFDEFMDDDMNTAKVLANMFELAPVINGIKNKQLENGGLSNATIELMQSKMKLFLEDILGFKTSLQNTNGKLEGIIELLINIRKEAKAKKDFVTSDKIRNELTALGVLLKDEKDGSVSYSMDN